MRKFKEEGPFANCHRLNCSREHDPALINAIRFASIRFYCRVLSRVYDDRLDVLLGSLLTSNKLKLLKLVYTRDLDLPFSLAN